MIALQITLSTGAVVAIIEKDINTAEEFKERLANVGCHTVTLMDKTKIDLRPDNIVDVKAIKNYGDPAGMSINKEFYKTRKGITFAIGMGPKEVVIKSDGSLIIADETVQGIDGPEVEFTKEQTLRLKKFLNDNYPEE